QDRLARRGAARYLRDSRALLVNLVGPAVPCRKTGGQYDITLAKERSRQLLRRMNLYEGGLGALEDQRLSTLVRQLESVLMQVAALDDCASARQIHDLREQIETRQILLRIDLVTREMEGRADVVWRPAHAAAPPSADARSGPRSRARAGVRVPGGGGRGGRAVPPGQGGRVRSGLDGGAARL